MVKRKRERASTISPSRSSSSSIPENGSLSAPENGLRSFPSTSSQSVPRNEHDCDLKLLPKQIKQETGDPSDLPNDWQGDKQVLAERFDFIFNSEKYADIHILVGKTEQRIPAHKLVLCVGSAVLDDILSKNEKFAMLMIPDVEPDIFLVQYSVFFCDCDVYLNGIGLFGSDKSTTETYMVEYSISEDMGESRIASKLFEAVEWPCDLEGVQKKGPNSLVNDSYTECEIAVPIPGMDQKVTFTFGEEHGVKIPEIYFTNIH